MQRVLPAEWYPQSGVMLTWPHPYGDWAPWLNQVEQVYLDLSRAITRSEQLLVVCFDDQHQRHIRTILNRAGIALDRVVFRNLPSNDSWARDHGPITILADGKPRLMDFGFNGWGQKYAATLDDLLSLRLYAEKTFADIDIESSGLILEGGSIDSDGQGTLLTTENCLLTPTRNPHLDKAAIEQILHDLLGVDRVLWLAEGELRGDDTDSHIDMLARFCDPATIAYTACENPADEHYAGLARMQAELEKLTDRNGKPYKLIPLPIPDPIYNAEGDRLPGSYANFLIINKQVLVPTYRDKRDQTALHRLRECFPNHEVVGIDCQPLIEQFGSLHCITMQLPQGVLRAG
ncbi:MAG: agmatine deiminase family protein [Gammaproteobacteria bacterium]|nr:agmatine deiminase family protein [Gammaproteobacteria bacterium]MDH5652649.1 agmatine deiminase family protein [Gammaproteobacteria bacterium]